MQIYKVKKFLIFAYLAKKLYLCRIFDTIAKLNKQNI